jgi:uncharacterized membrane protein
VGGRLTMAALTVWLFDDDRALEVVHTVTEFKRRGLVDVYDAALVRWSDGSEHAELTQLPELAGDHRFNDSFWSRLFGLVFFPASLGVGVSAAGDSLRNEDLGITPTMAEILRDEMQPGQAAMFVYSSGAFAESGEMAEEIKRTRKGVPTRLLSSNLDDGQDERLQEVFGR